MGENRKKVLKIYLIAFMVISLIMSPAIAFAADSSPLAFAGATKITFGQQYSGTYYSTGSDYKYSFDVTESGKVTIGLTSGSTSMYIYLYDQNGNRVDTFFTRPVGSDYVVYENDYLKSGTYYLETYSTKDMDMEDTPFTLTLAYSSSKESFPESLTSDDDSFANANSITFSKKYNGQISIQDTQDVFKIKVPASGNVSVSFSAGLAYARYILYDENNTKIRCINLSGGQSSISNTCTLSKGTYYLKVDNEMNGDGWFYNIKLTYNLNAQGKISSASRHSTKASVAYNSVSGASGYQIAYSTSASFVKNKTKYVTAVTGTSKLTKLEKNKTYYIHVRPYVKIDGKIYYGKYSKIKTLKK